MKLEQQVKEPEKEVIEGELFQGQQGFLFGIRVLISKENNDK